MFKDENVIFWNNIHKIKLQLEIDDLEMSTFFDLELNEYLQLQRKNKVPSLSKVFRFSEKLNIHFEDLLVPQFKLIQAGIKKNNQIKVVNFFFFILIGIFSLQEKKFFFTF